MLRQPSLPAPGLILLAILVTVAAVFDIRSRRIPNWLVLAGMVAGLAWNLSLSSLAGMGTGFALYFPLYLLRARGAGDVKLLTAVGAIAGPGNCLWIFFATALAGGAMALVLVIARGRLRQTLFNMSWILGDLARLRAPFRSSAELDVTRAKGLRLPHAAAIAAGTFAFTVAALGARHGR